ncbi:hypothetical protein HLB23_33300 [Nocardia uniformis]|uniref:Uncharacterized protein n=1 Tax=Nocardia uniformis TaxID=53432 RepID=A0A849C7U7_9NOCA|nr:hypothetical protein [Nocardia uniformis]NNH74672.1 hypothetical protein [Nocardia uniformis]
MSVDLAEIQRALAQGRALHAIVFPDTVTDDFPPRWQPIRTAADAIDRKIAALHLWNADFLDLIPEFAHALYTELADVRIGRLGDDWVLVYALEHLESDHRRVVCWIGWDPATFGADVPPFWFCVPRPLRTFLSQVHAGFTAPDRRSFGPLRPRGMRTLAEAARYPDGIPGWTAEPASTRTLAVALTQTGLYACVSCDLEPGLGLPVYAGTMEPAQPFGRLLDEILTARFADLDQEF